MSTTVCRPVLTSGSSHPDVAELGRLLAAAGHENSVSRGENPHNLVDESLLAAITAYRNAHQVDAEDAIPSVPAHERSRWIGPTLWAHILGDRDPESDESQAAAEQHEAEPQG